MFKNVLFVTLFAVVIAVGAKKPCCGPTKFMAGNGASVGQVITDPDTNTSHSEGFFTYQYGAFDFERKMFGYNMSVTYPNGTSTLIRLIQNYAQKYQYIILDALRYCQKQEVTEPQPTNCIPNNATWQSSFRIGGAKGGSLFADSWTYKFVHPKDAVQGDIVANVFQDDCSPFSTTFIGDRFQGDRKVPLISMGGLLNLTSGIPHPEEWFTVPDFCPKEINSLTTNMARSAPYLPNLDFLQLPLLF
nr:development-specific protein LVN1.2-like [Lytechinus pictus]